MVGSDPDRPSVETETRQADDVSRSVESRVTGLTVLFHPDLGRVGERAVLAELASGSARSLSRREPTFAAPGGNLRRDLGDASISRRPIRLEPGEADGSIALVSGGSRTAVEVDGEVMTDRVTLSRADIERGVVLLLGGRIVLLLHLLDPLSAVAPATPGLIGESPDMARVRREIEQVADLEVPVLLRGETGTGKELVARAIHDTGPRRNLPFVAVNMAAIPPSLAAAELFGAAKGAFTGAQRDRVGYFGRAQGGTLFLDEIGDAPQGIQALLLRALEVGEIQPVGAERPHKVDVRVISATDRDLEAAIHHQGFRAPLLFRLGGFTLRLPPLRARREDFGRLFVAFLRRELVAVGEPERLAPDRPPWVPATLVARLARYDWPGNVRQLANTVRQMVIAHRGSDRVALPQALDALVGSGPERPSGLALDRKPLSEPASLPRAGIPRPRRPIEVHEDELVRALQANRWRLQDTADQLGIARSSLYRLIAKTGRIRKASDLSRAEIQVCHQTHDGSIARMADTLEVSERALRRQMAQLGIPQ